DSGGGGGGGEDPETIGESDVHPAHNDADDAKETPAPAPAPAPARPCPTCAGTGDVTGDVTGGPSPFARPRVDPRRLLPQATLYFHLAEESLRTGTGVARFEGVGPLTLPQLREFLGHTNVRVVPVADLAGQRPVDGYEVPARMREATHLRSPACISPWGTNLSRRKDMEHITPYLPPARGGPPGQTSMDNLGPLSRHPHRVKTHGRWTLTQTGPGSYEWRTPHGYRFAVDQHGTHALGKADPEQARATTGQCAPGRPGDDPVCLASRSRARSRRAARPRHRGQ
ncbi:MAG TPA: hypothetical protein VK204_10690, partial [Nocardioidaceae bacterium]|nr:hypothetical protein [Nocardioidaceae bacterium]